MAIEETGRLTGFINLKIAPETLNHQTAISERNERECSNLTDPGTSRHHFFIPQATIFKACYMPPLHDV